MTEKDLSDAKEIIAIYRKTPKEKRPLLTAMANAYLAGMEAQKRLMEGCPQKGRLTGGAADGRR